MGVWDWRVSRFNHWTNKYISYQNEIRGHRCMPSQTGVSTETKYQHLSTHIPSSQRKSWWAIKQQRQLIDTFGRRCRRLIRQQWLSMQRLLKELVTPHQTYASHHTTYIYAVTKASVMFVYYCIPLYRVKYKCFASCTTSLILKSFTRLPPILTYCQKFISFILAASTN